LAVRHGINPFDYLKDLFTRLPSAKITQVRDFTPAAWSRARNKKQFFAVLIHGVTHDLGGTAGTADLPSISAKASR